MPRTSTSSEARPSAPSTSWLAAVCAVALLAVELVGPASPAPQGRLSTLPALATPSHRSATVLWWQIGRGWASGAPMDADATLAGIRRIGQLDPQWRTPWVYGGLMLQVEGAEQAAEALLSEASDRWPADPWFPGALGVQLQDQGRIEEARAWLRAARERS